MFAFGTGRLGRSYKEGDISPLLSKRRELILRSCLLEAEFSVGEARSMLGQNLMQKAGGEGWIERDREGATIALLNARGAAHGVVQLGKRPARSVEEAVTDECSLSSVKNADPHRAGHRGHFVGLACV